MKYLLVILICTISFQSLYEKITKIRAEKIAKNWGTMYLGMSKTDIVKKKSCYFKYENDRMAGKKT